MISFHGPNHAAAYLIITELNRLGVVEYVLSPGSRSTPLALALTDQTTPITVHIDERGAAFYALGLAQASGRPAVLICTSGTAVANYLPAVVEASQSGIPLVLLTADRPADAHRSGANQTILQDGIFSHYVRDSVTIPAPSDHLDSRFVLSSIDRAFSLATGRLPGPVHINVAFRKPLVTLAADSTLSDVPEKWLHGPSPYSLHAGTQTTPLLPDAVLHLLKNAKRGVILAAQVQTTEQPRALLRVAERLSWPLITDATSQVRFGPVHPLVMTGTGQYLEDAQTRESLSPDVLLHIGGAPICNGLLEFMRCARTIVHIALRGQSVDLYHSVAAHAMVTDLAALEEGLRPLGSIHSDLTEAYKPYEAQSRELVQSTLITENSELAALQVAVQSVPADTALFFGNSLPIRISNLINAELDYYPPIGFNRGASGIDGIIASAVGFATGLRAPLLLINGDISTIHDANSLLLARNSTFPITILVINNGGGAIFSTLPAFPAPEYFEHYFLTPQNADLEGLAHFAGLPFHRTNSVVDLPRLVRDAAHARTSSIIEFCTSWQISQNALTALRSGV